MVKDTSVCSTVNLIGDLQLMLGRGACVFFSGNPRAHLSRVNVNKLYPVIGRPDDESILSVLIDEPFRQEAQSRGLTLVQCLQTARDGFETHRSQPRPVETVSRLAGLLSRVAPGESGTQLLERLRALLKTSGEAAAQLLDQYESRNGRDQDGFILLRGKQVQA